MRVGKKLRNKNGFTLIELIAVIFIMGIMLILSLPQVSKIQQANKNKKYETYEKSIERGAKLYTDSNAKDMFGNNNSGCVTIPYSALKSSNVIKDFGDSEITCSSDAETYVQIRKINDDYRYDVALTCRQDGEVVYQKTIDNTFTCTNSPDTEVPKIEANPSSKDWVRTQDLEITIKISDESGLNRNTSIKYYWVKTSGEKVGKEYTHNYNNKKVVTKVSYKIPKNNMIDTNGQYYLVVEPYRTTTANGVQDALGNDRITEERFGIYKIDNTKPSCGVADGEKTKWTNTDFTITQHCSDGESGCVKESYSKKFTESTTTHTFTIKDKAGNTNKCKVNVYLDKDKPTCGKTKGESTEWTNKDRTISVECEEKEFSKCKKDVFEVTFSTDGKKDNMEIQDNAGNKTQCSVNKYIDKTPPKCPTISSTTPAGKWTNKDITYTFKFTSDTSKYIWYTKVGDNDWKEWSTNKPSVTQKSITAEGYRKVGVRVYDAAGNNQLCGADPDYKIDKTAPYTPYLDRNATAILDGVVVLANVYGKCDAACFAAEPGRQNSVILQQNGTPCFEQLDCNVSPHSKSVGKCYFSKKWPCGDHQWTAEDDYSHAADVSGIKSISRLSFRDHGCLNERNQGDYSETHYHAVDNAGNVSADLKVTILNTALYPAAVLHKYYEVRDYEWKLRSGMTRPERQNSSCFS